MTQQAARPDGGDHRERLTLHRPRTWRPHPLFQLTRGHRTALALGSLIAIAALVAGLTQPLLVRQVVNAAGHGAMPWTAAGGLAVLFAAQALLQAASAYLLGRTSEDILWRTRRNLVSRLLRLPMADYQRNRLGDFISRAGADTTSLRIATGHAYSDAVTGVLGLAATLGLMAWLDLRLLAVAGAVAVAVALIVLPALSRMRPASEEGQQALGRLTADLERALSAIRTVRTCGATDRETARITAHADTARAAGVRIARLDALLMPASELTLRAALVATIIIGASGIAHGTTTTADLMAFVLYLDFLAQPLTAIINAAASIQQAAGATTRITQVLHLPQEPQDRLACDPVPRPAEGATALEFQDVWFAYEPDRPVLRGLTFQLPTRSVTALIGDSGAGKTTVFSLIARLHTPDRGRILLQGTDIHELPLGQYRRVVSLVEQNSPVLHGTLRENLTYATPGLSDTDLWHTLDLTGLTAFVHSLPDGLDTVIGDHGTTLSGGQRQRIAITRALAAKPALILLDEPTAHLDPAAERSLLHTLHAVARHCTLLVITHSAPALAGIDRRLHLNRP